MKRVFLRTAIAVLALVVAAAAFTGCGSGNGGTGGTNSGSSGRRTSEGLKYTLAQDQQSYIVSGNNIKRSTDVIIPSQYKKLPVSAIGDNAFKGNTVIKNVTVGSNVVSVGNNAFRSCTSLESVVIPEGVKAIGDYAFGGCSALNAAELPASLMTIGDYAFTGCRSLKAINLPAGVAAIGESAFSGCCEVESMTVSEDNAVYIAKGDCIIEFASKTLVAGCKNSVIPDDGSVQIIAIEAFAECVGLESITLPSGLTAISESAFAGCTGLKSVNIPASVTDISVCAFEECAGLEEITAEEGNPRYQSAGNCLIETGTKTLVAGCKASVIPADGSVEAIAEKAFSKCEGIVSLTVPGSVKQIGNYAFYNISSLENIVLEEGVERVGGCAFAACPNLKTAKFPASLKLIVAKCFFGCGSLSSVEFAKTDGWKTASNASGSDGKTVSVGDPAAAAKALTGEHESSFWVNK
ncbi:MAG: leucine-rich repeat domain-containing protein [Clostridia bacterium]|nr:leucine-rich repeat domain-containing protein [Clostridia bacterium]